MKYKYEIYSSIDNPGTFEVHNGSGTTMIGYAPYVIEGTKEECEEFCKKWNKE